MTEPSPSIMTDEVSAREGFDEIVTACGLCVQQFGHDPLLDSIARQAADLFQAPIGLVTLVDEREQLFAGKVGIDLRGTSRDESFCAYTILQDVPLVVEDAREDARFAHLKLVTGPPNIRFYVGAPIVDGGGMPLGSVCVLDTEPHTPSSQRLITLEKMAVLAGVALNTRRLFVDHVGTTPFGTTLPRVLGELNEALTPLLSLANGSRGSRF